MTKPPWLWLPHPIPNICLLTDPPDATLLEMENVPLPPKENYYKTMKCFTTDMCTESIITWRCRTFLGKNTAAGWTEQTSLFNLTRKKKNWKRTPNWQFDRLLYKFDVISIMVGCSYSCFSHPLKFHNVGKLTYITSQGRVFCRREMLHEWRSR